MEGYRQVQAQAEVRGQQARWRAGGRELSTDWGTRIRKWQGVLQKAWAPLCCDLSKWSEVRFSEVVRTPAAGVRSEGL